MRPTRSVEVVDLDRQCPLCHGADQCEEGCWLENCEIVWLDEWRVDWNGTWRAQMAKKGGKKKPKC